MKRKGKKGQVWGTLAPWIIGIAVLVILLIVAYLMRERLADYGRAIIRLFRGGGLG
jgi:hypothetical protein